MRARWAVLAVALLAALAAGVLVARQWGGRVEPASTAARPEPRAVAEEAQGGPPGAPEGAPAGPSAGFAPPRPEPAAPPRPVGAPGARKARAARDRAAPRSGTASRVRIRATTPELRPYFDEVAAEIGGQWKVPEPAQRRSATIPMVLKVDRDGRVLWTLVEASSGDAALDRSVAELIEQVKRDGLPRLPDHYPYDELDIGLLLVPAGAGAPRSGAR